MARCPRCRTKQDYRTLLSPKAGKLLPCKQCGTPLRVSKLWLFPYALVVAFVASVLGLTMILSKQYATFSGLFVAWLVISVALYPLVVVLTASDKRV